MAQGVQRRVLHAVVGCQPDDRDPLDPALTQQFLEPGLIEARVALGPRIVPLVDDHVEQPVVEEGMELGPLGVLNAMHGPRAALTLERTVVGRMPVPRGHHEGEAGIGGQRVHMSGDRVTFGYRQRASGGEVILKVDDHEGLGHVRDDIAVRDLLLTPEEAALMDAPGSTDAAVLVALYPEPLTAIFTERRADLRRHAGEISFPGGRQDEPDEDLRLTALREAEEEIGLPPAAVEIVGALPPVGTFVTGYRVFSFVGTIERGHVWAPAEAEVAQVLEFALADLVAGHEMRRLLRKGVPIRTPTYTVDGHLIWGATARIVQSLLERLSPVL